MALFEEVAPPCDGRLRVSIHRRGQIMTNGRACVDNFYSYSFASSLHSIYHTHTLLGEIPRVLTRENLTPETEITGAA